MVWIIVCEVLKHQKEDWDNFLVRNHFVEVIENVLSDPMDEAMCVRQEENWVINNKNQHRKGKGSKPVR